MALKESGYKTRKITVTKENVARIPKKNFDLWEEFRRDMLLAKGDKAKQTLKTYKSAILGFLIWLVDNYGEKSFKEINHKIVKKYLFYCQEGGNNGKIRNTKTSAISSMLNFCVREDYLEYNPLDKKLQRADTADEQVIEQPFLTQEQVDEIRVKISEIKKEEKRFLYGLIFELGFSTASRVGAWEQFSEENLDLENKAFIDIREKESKIRELNFSKKGQELLREWLQYKKDNGIDTPAIYAVKYAGKWGFMSKERLQEIAKEICAMIGIHGHAHTFRKSFSNISKSRNVPIEKIQEKLGHSSSETTVKFYTKKDNKKNQKVFDELEL